MEKKITPRAKMETWGTFILFFIVMSFTVTRVIIILYKINVFIAILIGLITTILATIFQIRLKKRKVKNGRRAK